MTNSRKPGSDRGRPAVDWEQAFAHYASLPATERTYAAVAKAFGVSARTVERHGREEHWRQRLREIEAEVSANTRAAIVEARSEQRTNTIKLILASLIAYADKLRRDDIRMIPGDLEKLNRLYVQLEAELDPPAFPAVAGAAAPPTSSPQHLVEVLDALAETGALNALGLQRIPPCVAESDSEAV